MRFLTVLFLLTLAAPAAAEDKPHKINFAATLVDEDQTPPRPMCSAVLGQDGSCAKPWTLGLVARMALNAPQNNGQGVSPETKDRRGELAHQLAGGGEVSLLDADLKDLKTCIGNFFTPTMVHQAWRMLDGKPPVEDAKQ